MNAGTLRRHLFWGVCLLLLAALTAPAASGQTDGSRKPDLPEKAPAGKKTAAPAQTPAAKLDAATNRALDENPFPPADRSIPPETGRRAEIARRSALGEGVRFLSDILRAGKGGRLLRAARDQRFALSRPQSEIGGAAADRGHAARGARSLRVAVWGPGAADARRGAAARRCHAPGGGLTAFLSYPKRLPGHVSAGPALLRPWPAGVGRTLLAATARVRPVAEEEFEPALSLTLATCWLRTGVVEKARQALVSLRERHPTAELVVAGHKVPLFSGETDAVDWLCGNRRPSAGDTLCEVGRLADVPRRMSPATPPRSGGAPLLNLRWRVPLTDEPPVGRRFGERERASQEPGEPMLPSFHPLAVGDVLLMRTCANSASRGFCHGQTVVGGDG